MRKKKTQFTQEFKMAAVKLVAEQGYSQAEAAQNLGIDAKNLNRWLHEKTSTHLSAKNKQLSLAEQEELQQLRKENKRLKLEREILKKAATFFANELH